jgi:hypothetical protein
LKLKRNKKKLLMEKRPKKNQERVKPVKLQRKSSKLKTKSRPMMLNLRLRLMVRKK